MTYILRNRNEDKLTYILGRMEYHLLEQAITITPTQPSKDYNNH
jgi:hypothetical protein